MRSIRGLYVIRSGAPVRASTKPARAADEQAAGDVPDDGRLGTLDVDFSRFDSWYEINSWFEGQFLERTVKGAFKRTIAAHWRAAKGNGGDTMKVLFNHGMDMYINDKPLGVPEVLEEREDSPHLEAPLLDTSYNRDLEPLLRAGALGSSFMFEVLGEKWDREPEKSDHNPEGLPERTITEVRLFEAGPVTWPANPEATAGLRSASGTDWLIEQVRTRDASRCEQLEADLRAFRARHGLRTLSEDDRPATPKNTPAPPKTPAPGDEPARHVDGITAAARRRRLRIFDMAKR